jgi:hypothetical protein
MGFVVVQDPQTAKPYTIKIAGDSPTEDEQRQIQQFIEEQREVVDQAPVETPDDKSGTAIGRGFGLGIDVLQQLYGSALEGIGEETGIKALENYGKSVVETNEQQIAEKQQAFTRREDIGKDGSYVGDSLSFYGETLGQQLPQFAPIIAGGAIGQALIPIPFVGATIGALAANLPMFFGSHRERDKEADIKYGRPVEVDNLTSFLYAIPAALLDTVVDRFLLAIPRGLGLSKSALSPSVGGLFTRAAKGAGAGAVVEVPTELGQQVIERYQAGLPIDDDEAMKEYVDVAIASGLVGGTVRATTSAVTGDTKENIEKKEAALAKAQLDIDNANQTAEADQLKQNLEQNVKEGFGEATPLAIGAEEGTVLTAGLEPTEQKLNQRSEGIIDIDDLNRGAKNALVEERFKKGLNPTNPITDLREVKSLLEPRFPNITNRLIQEINTVKVPKRYDETQYDTVVKSFKDNDVDLTEVNRDTILDKVKKVLTKKNETDQGGVVTTTTAQNIVDQMVLDGHISLARNTEFGKTPDYVVNQQSLNDKRTQEIQQDRDALEVQRVDLKKSKEEKKIIQEDIGNLNQEKNKVVQETKPLLSELQARSQARPSNINRLEMMRIQSNLNKKAKQIRSIDNKIAKKDLELGDKEIEVESRTSEAKRLIDNIRRLNAENKAINPSLPRSVKSATSFRSQQQNANNSLITAEQATQVRKADLKSEYKTKRDSVVESLQKYLKRLNLADVKLVSENIVGSQGKDLSKKDYIVEGEFTDRDGRRAIALSMELYDPNLSETEYENRLKSVLNHEIIHAVKSLGLFTDAEYQSLVKAAMTRKYVIKDGKKLIQRKYTYFDRAKSLYPDLKQEGIQEEAIAEMFRDAMDGKIKLVGKPKTLMQRFIDFFKSIFNAHEENGFQSVDDIFKEIKSGTIGKRDRSADREYLKTKQSDQAQEGKQSRKSLGRQDTSIEFAEDGVRANKLPHQLLVRNKIRNPRDVPTPVVQEFTPNNKEAVLANIDQALANNPEALSSIENWLKLESEVFGDTHLPVPPFKAIEYANSPQAMADQLSLLTPEMKKGVDEGFSYVNRLRDLYNNKEATPKMTADLFVWGLLSRGAGPVQQEGAFIDIIDDAKDLINKVVGGNFTEADKEVWKSTISKSLPLGSPGRQVTQNVNATADLLLELSKPFGDQTVLQRIHDMIGDPNVSAKEIRREFFRLTDRAGIDNKVVSFILLVAGRDDVLVMDRIQGRHLWDDGSFNDFNLYDGYRKEGSTAKEGLQAIFRGPRSVVITEALEDGLRKNVEETYKILGRPEDASLGRWHWENWVIKGEQVVSHSTLKAVADQSAVGTSVTEGKFATFSSGTRYLKTDKGTVVEFPLSDGNFVYMTPTRQKEFEAFIKNAKNKIVPRNFKVSENIKKTVV